MDEYRHTQVAKPTLILIAMVGALLIAMLAWEGFPHLPTALTLILLLIVAGVSSLTVTVDRGRIECRFGPGVFRKRFAVSHVRGVTAVRNRWWYGWGIRWSPHGWLFNVSGLDAVELELSNGKRVRIGTDEPNELVAAIRRAISRARD